MSAAGRHRSRQASSRPSNEPCLTSDLPRQPPRHSAISRQLPAGVRVAQQFCCEAPFFAGEAMISFSDADPSSPSRHRQGRTGVHSAVRRNGYHGVGSLTAPLRKGYPRIERPPEKRVMDGKSQIRSFRRSLTRALRVLSVRSCPAGTVPLRCTAAASASTRRLIPRSRQTDTTSGSVRQLLAVHRKEIPTSGSGKVSSRSSRSSQASSSSLTPSSAN